MKSAIVWQECIKLAAGKQELAVELLEKFIEDLDVSHSQISKYFQSKDFENLQAEVHKLHGACCYCGVPQLKIICREFEADLKNDQVDSIDKHFDALSNEINRVQQAFQSKAFAAS